VAHPISLCGHDGHIVALLPATDVVLVWRGGVGLTTSPAVQSGRTWSRGLSTCGT